MANNCTIKVYKDGWTPSRPWCADVIWEDGKVWKGWQHGWRTRKAMVSNITAAIPHDVTAEIVG